MAEKPVKLSELQPGAQVAQRPKTVVETRWCLDGITLLFDDGTVLEGQPTDSVYVLRAKAPDVEPAPPAEPEPATDETVPTEA